MKPISITLQPPITEYCTKCEYEAAREFHSTLVVCPKCGERCISKGSPSKSISKKAITITKQQESYDRFHSEEKQFRYIIHNVPDGNTYSFCIEEDIDISDPLETIVELYEIIKGFFLSSQKGEIEKIYQQVIADKTER